VTSVHRGGHYIVAVVMGGHSSLERDAHMRELIGAYINKTAFRRSAPVIAEHQHHQSLALAGPPVAADPADPIRPLIVTTITLQTAQEQSTSPAPRPEVLSAAAPALPPNASQPSAQIAARWPSTGSATNEPPTDFASANPTAKLSPQAMPSVAKAPEVEPRDVEPERNVKPRAHGSWLIQIGAFDGEDEAKRRLTAVRLKLSAAIAGTEPSIERGRRGSKAVYRARFTGFDKASAESACKQLKRGAFECIALQN
jgi:D-alanyl-D-alanine carboxypeptidase